MNEPRWLPVFGYEGLYEVSEDGEVRSLDCKAVDGRRIVGRLLKLFPTARGYLRISLYKAGEKRSKSVHSMVLEAFVGPRPDGLIACHNDGNKLNNRYTNLRWDTPKANSLDLIKHGTLAIGERHGNAKLTAELVVLIRKRHRDGGKFRTLGREFSMSARQVKSICDGEYWRHVPMTPVPA